MKLLPPFLTRATPNPNAYVFEFPDVEELAPFPLAARREQVPTGIAVFDQLLAVDTVQELYLSANFLTVVKSDAKEWFELTVELRSLIRAHLDPSELLEPDRTAAFQVKPLSANHPFIHEWFAQRILPATERDGGGIYVRAYEDGRLKVEAVGACSGCPHFPTTVEQGIRQPLEQQLQRGIDVVLID